MGQTRTLCFPSGLRISSDVLGNVAGEGNVLVSFLDILPCRPDLGQAEENEWVDDQIFRKLQQFTVTGAM